MSHEGFPGEFMNTSFWLSMLIYPVSPYLIMLMFFMKSCMFMVILSTPTVFPSLTTFLSMLTTASLLTLVMYGSETAVPSLSRAFLYQSRSLGSYDSCGLNSGYSTYPPSEVPYEMKDILVLFSFIFLKSSYISFSFCEGS